LCAVGVIGNTPNLNLWKKRKAIRERTQAIYSKCGFNFILRQVIMSSKEQKQ
jgi:hypothetical protein